MTRFVILLLSFGVAFAQTKPVLGNVVETQEACQAGQIPNTTCKILQVACPGLKPIQVQIRITAPAAGVPLRGTVVVGSGAGGNGLYAGQEGGKILVTEVAAMG